MSHDEESEDQRARSFARAGITSPLLRLAANVMRVVRGAGQPYGLVFDCRAVLLAFDEFRARTGDLPSDHEIAEILRFEIPELQLERVAHLSKKGHHATARMTSGALQFVAASLLNQIPQRATGRFDMIAGATQYMEYEEELEAERARKEREAKAAKRRPAGAARPKKA